jgi:hypothetical protein
MCSLHLVPVLSSIWVETGSIEVRYHLLTIPSLVPSLSAHSVSSLHLIRWSSIFFVQNPLRAFFTQRTHSGACSHLRPLAPAQWRFLCSFLCALSTRHGGLCGSIAHQPLYLLQLLPPCLGALCCHMSLGFAQMPPCRDMSSDQVLYNNKLVFLPQPPFSFLSGGSHGLMLCVFLHVFIPSPLEMGT